MEVRRSSRRKAEINIVPLIDVLTVLLFFLLVTMQFRNVNVLNIQVPEIETAGQNEFSQQIEIAINEAGEFFLNNQPVTREALEEALQLAGDVAREQPVLVIADEDTPLHNVTWVMDACRRNNLEDFRLQSR
ncbi:MAG: ExbD/TolR family protein [Verrucomicrobiota bacterium]